MAMEECSKEVEEEDMDKRGGETQGASGSECQQTVSEMEFISSIVYWS